MVPRIPRVGGRDSGIGGCRQIPDEIVGLSRGPECGLLIVRVVARGGKDRGNIGPRERAAGFDPLAGSIIRIREVPQSRSALFIGQAREFGGRIVRIGDAVRIGIRHAGSLLHVIVDQRHVT